MCLATPRHKPHWPIPRHRPPHAPLGAAAFGIATLASLRSPQRGVQRKAKAFYRIEFTPPRITRNYIVYNVCNTCGSKMFKWVDCVKKWDYTKKSSAENKYFAQFFSQQELDLQLKKRRIKNLRKESSGLGCLAGIVLTPFVYAGAHFFLLKNGLLEWEDSDFNPIIFCLLIPITFFITSRLNMVLKIYDTTKNDFFRAEKYVKEHVEKIILGDGVNGEEVIFHQDTGKIEYISSNSALR